eukprot:scaffold237342_cov23-Tisochrysis_lutea.AAC.2
MTIGVVESAGSRKFEARTKLTTLPPMGVASSCVVHTPSLVRVGAPCIGSRIILTVMCRVERSSAEADEIV